MSQAQKGVCAEPNLHALYLVFNVFSEEHQQVKLSLAKLLDVFDHYDHEYYEAMVSGMIAVGSNYWTELYPDASPKDLAPFPTMQCEDRHAPAEPADIFVQIRADRMDICHALGIEVCNVLCGHMELIEQVKSFRYLDGRDLTGFVDGTENPKGMKKFDVALVGDEDAGFAGGSYIHIQRYRHNLFKWQSLQVPEQEQIIGRTKERDIEFSGADKANFAHVKRANVKDAHGKSLEILRQSMPYGDMNVQGLYFVSCCRSPKPFELMLKSMIFGDEKGVHDRLMDYTFAETGGAFFAPSVKFIKNQAEN